MRDVPERALAQLAVLGWIVTNLCSFIEREGSFTYCVVLSDANPLLMPFDADRCGPAAAPDACPTDAFVGPRELDARACISYLTIEHRGEFDDAQRGAVGGGPWVFGCDVCQDVCPWNVSFAQETADPGFAPRAEVAAPDLRALLEIGEEEFARRYGATPFSRPGRAGMRRNAAAVLAGAA